MLRDLLPQGTFWPPATEGSMAAVEAKLGVRFPEQLRALYLEADGFREDLGNAKCLLSLTEEDFIGSLVSVTGFCWKEMTESFPRLDLTPFIFFGSSSGDELWGINWRQPAQIIAYHHSMGGKFEVVGSDILKLCQADFASYSIEE